jgi:hypothetical protein
LPRSIAASVRGFLLVFDFFDATTVEPPGFVWNLAFRVISACSSCQGPELRTRIEQLELLGREVGYDESEIIEHVQGHQVPLEGFVPLICPLPMVTREPVVGSGYGALALPRARRRAERSEVCQQFKRWSPDSIPRLQEQ